MIWQNIAAVLKKMLDLGLDITCVWAVKGSYLERYLIENKINYNTYENKNDLVRQLQEADFDIFISNGLPVILPITELSKSGKMFVNIHPSLLPDLRGCDPVPGAILFGKNSGATCHIMDDGIDTGGIISQVEIPISEDIDVGLLYQISFMAEAKAFEEAYHRNFMVNTMQESKEDNIYYSFADKDLMIKLDEEESDALVRRVRAFSTKNKGARIIIKGNEYIINDAQIISNKVAISFLDEVIESETGFFYENKVIVKNRNGYIKFTLR